MNHDIDPADVLYVGTYTAPHSAPGEPMPSEALGIYVFKRLQDGQLELAQTVPAENPSFLTIAPDRRTLYAVSEMGPGDDNTPLGQVLAFRRDLETGMLEPLNSQPTQGTWPCHLSVTGDGRFLLAANYGSGGFVVFPLDQDGRIGAIAGATEDVGRGPDTARQNQSHPHFIADMPELGCILGTDLGVDRVNIWTLNAADGTLQAQAPIQTAGGTGPRHLVVHPASKQIIVLNELSSTVDVFSAASGADTGPETGTETGIETGPIWRQTLSTLPADGGFVRPIFDPASPGFVADGGNTTAEIRLHPSGRFLYVTNRGMNSVACFGFDETFERLEPLGWTSTRGQRPRGMNISPDGRFLYVGNQGSNTILGFSIDGTSGALSEPIFEIPCPTPVDFAF